MLSLYFCSSILINILFWSVFIWRKNGALNFKHLKWNSLQFRWQGFQRKVAAHLPSLLGGITFLDGSCLLNNVFQKTNTSIVAGKFHLATFWLRKFDFFLFGPFLFLCLTVYTPQFTFWLSFAFLLFFSLIFTLYFLLFCLIVWTTISIIQAEKEFFGTNTCMSTESHLKWLEKTNFFPVSIRHDFYSLSLSFPPANNISTFFFAVWQWMNNSIFTHRT